MDFVYPPPLGYVKYVGEGLLFTEGWLWRRIALISIILLAFSFIFAVIWSVVFTVEQGVAIGGYILAISAFLLSLIGVLSVLGELE